MNSVLANVTTLRILPAAAGPSWKGDKGSASLGIDNITAVPEPMTLSLLSIGGLALLRRQKK